MKKILFVILDGLGDRPISELGNKTPLEAAVTPNMDFLAQNGMVGLQNMLPEGVYPTSEECHLALFGYDYIKDYPGRGVLEALGAGIELGENDIAFRINIGTVDKDLKLVDPHAGGVGSIKELTDSLQNIEIDGVIFDIYPTLQHRGVLVLRSDRKLAPVTDTDPHKTGAHEKNATIIIPKSFDGSEEGEFTAKVLREYQLRTNEILINHSFNKKRISEGKMSCNFVLTRGAGIKKDVEPFEKKHGLKATAVAGAPLYKGIARYLGMDLNEDPSFTGKADTNLAGKVSRVTELLTANSQQQIADFVYLHIKATDTFAEDFGDFIGKRDFISKIDNVLMPLLNLENVIIMVTGDHTTSCIVRDHVLDPVPFLIYGAGKDGEAEEFGENACKNSGFYLKNNLIDKVKELAEE